MSDRARMLRIALRDWGRWASWKNGFNAGEGGTSFSYHAAVYDLDDLEGVRDDRRAAALVRWILEWVPVYRALGIREAWEAFAHEARRRNRLRREDYPSEAPCSHELAYFALVSA